ncbi:MAG: nitrate/nitrite transporter NrtS [Gammaproteobacteria bacterium]|nr:nitrate/nitrite transporter NrtS [Gammaproteobacteria bacterium]
MNPWLQTALRRDIIRRSLRIAVIVGTIIILINYYDRILGGTLVRGDFVKMALTYCVPYCVSTWAAVGAVLHRRHGN